MNNRIKDDLVTVSVFVQSRSIKITNRIYTIIHNFIYFDHKYVDVRLVGKMNYILGFRNTACHAVRLPPLLHGSHTTVYLVYSSATIRYDVLITTYSLIYLNYKAYKWS